MSEEAERKIFPAWCILELFGHQQIAGYVEVVVVGGDAFLRVDVPAFNDGKRIGKQFSKLFSPRSVYSMSFVDEEIATEAAKNIQAKPVTTYSMESIQEELVERINVVKENYERQIKMIQNHHHKELMDLRGNPQKEIDAPFEDDDIPL